MKFLKSVFFMVLIFPFVSIYAEAVVTGYNPDWSLYYSFDNILYRSNYSNAVVDHKDTNDLTPRGKYKDLNGNTIYPYSISTTSPFKGRAAALDGTRYIEMGGRYPLYSLGAAGDHEITISLWVKFSNSAPNGNDCFIAKNTDAGGDKFLFGIWSSQIMVRINSNYRLQTYVDGTNGSTIDVYDSNWHHFAVAIKEDSLNPGISKVTLWIDGSKKWTNSTISNILSDSDMTTGQIPSIGMDLDGTGLTKTDLLEGYVDELQIFSAVGNDTDAANLYNGRFGVPFDFDVWTSSIEIYDTGTLGGPHDNADGFLYNAHLSLDAIPVVPPLTDPYHYYEYLNAVADFSNVAHDENVLIFDLPDGGWMSDTDQNSHEIVFHAGHGHPRGPRDWNNTFADILTPDQFTYSGSTRWVFWQSCSTMKLVVHGRKPCSLNDEPCCSNSAVNDICYGGTIYPSPYFSENVGLNWFGDRFDSTSGPHAFFGFASIMIFASSGGANNGCDWSRNGYTPNYTTSNGPGSDYCPSPNNDNNCVLFNQVFWEDVVKNNTPIWEAYKDAVEDRMWYNCTVDEPRFSAEATIAYKYDDDTGFDGSMEQWNSTYREGSSSSMTLAMSTEIFQGCIEWSSPMVCANLKIPIYREDWR